MNITLTNIKKDKKILRKTLEKVKFPISDKTKDIIESMINYINNSQKPEFEDRAGVGIAANQIGVDLKMFYINVPIGNDEYYTDFFINPEFTAESAKESALEHGEGCLSVSENHPKTEGLVTRRFKVTIKGYSYLQKKEVEITKSGYSAIVLQHEMDHINGGLFFDRINNKQPWEPKKGLIII